MQYDSCKNCNAQNYLVFLSLRRTKRERMCVPWKENAAANTKRVNIHYYTDYPTCTSTQNARKIKEKHKAHIKMRKKEQNCRLVQVLFHGANSLFASILQKFHSEKLFFLLSGLLLLKNCWTLHLNDDDDDTITQGNKHEVSDSWFSKVHARTNNVLFSLSEWWRKASLSAAE